MKAFIEWLENHGYSVTVTRWSFTCRKDGEYLFKFTDQEDEEFPEALVWCLKELERRGLQWLLQSMADGSYAIMAVQPFASRSSANGSGSTMTQAAINALVSTSGVKEE